mgnify:CR=1 FL=1
MSNLTLNKIKERLENEVWYQELRLNAKNPLMQIKQTKDKEIAINRKELAESILNLIEKGKTNVL